MDTLLKILGWFVAICMIIGALIYAVAHHAISSLLKPSVPAIEVTVPSGSGSTDTPASVVTSDDSITGIYSGSGSSRTYCITVPLNTSRPSSASEFYSEIRFYDSDGQRIYLQESTTGDEPEADGRFFKDYYPNGVDWKVTLDATDLKKLQGRNAYYNISIGYIKNGKKIETERYSDMPIR